MATAAQSSPSAEPSSVPLPAFLCHSSGDKEAVRNLYKRLRTDGFAAWLDEEDLLPAKTGTQRSEGPSATATS
jgi:hypothetical protein